MAKKFLFVDVDITFPDDMADDDYTGEDLLPPAASIQEVRKILEAGSTSEGFDIEHFLTGKATRNGLISDILVDLVEQ